MLSLTRHSSGLPIFKAGLYLTHSRLLSTATYLNAHHPHLSVPHPAPHYHYYPPPLSPPPPSSSPPPPPPLPVSPGNAEQLPPRLKGKFFLSSYPPPTTVFFTRSYDLNFQLSNLGGGLDIASSDTNLRGLKLPPNLKMAEVKDGNKMHSVLNSTHPVFVPEEKALRYGDEEFAKWVEVQLSKQEQQDTIMTEAPAEDDYTIVESEKSDITALSEVKEQTTPQAEKRSHPFVDALVGEEETNIPPSADNLTLTTNLMPAHISTLSPTLDLFTDLSQGVSAARRNDLLTQAWAHDQLVTLKIIFNSRSIHLGKSDKENFYTSLGWLVRTGRKKTVLGNLGAVVGRLIERPKKEKAEKKIEEGETQKTNVEQRKESVVEEEESEQDKEAKMLSHGYWKDLLNLCVLEVCDALRVDAETHTILNPMGNPPKNRSLKRRKFKSHTDSNKQQRTEGISEKKEIIETEEEKEKRRKEQEHKAEKARHERFLEKWNDEKEPFYKLLHLTVARLFAQQLQKDLELHKTRDKKNLHKLSLAAKWAPSLEGHHDTRTFLASTIAEYLFPETHPVVHNKFNTREGYLKLAREHYRMKYLSPLRKALAVVERDVSANTFANINYSRVPSLAMQRYTKLFILKDNERFVSFLREVAKGKANISGATLTPGGMVAKIRSYQYVKPSDVKKLAEEKVEREVINAQWNTLVQSVKERGVLDNLLAIIDVSGSMSSPRFRDGTCPMDQAVGLGLLLSEASEEPWKGLTITFSQNPNLINLYESSGEVQPGEEQEGQGPKFHEKVNRILGLDWGMNTDFIAVFRKLILPRAIAHKLKPEEMVKKLFVFSDMQFDSAYSPGDYSRVFGKRPKWKTGYQTLKREFEEAGYEIPELIFWNLAGQIATGSSKMPVEKDTPGVTMLSGFGAGMLKGFLDGGLGESEEDVEEIVEEEEEEEDGDGFEKTVNVKKVVKKKDPVENMMKILGNRAYEGLQVLD